MVISSSRWSKFFKSLCNKKESIEERCQTNSYFPCFIPRKISKIKKVYGTKILSVKLKSVEYYTTYTLRMFDSNVRVFETPLREGSASTLNV